MVDELCTSAKKSPERLEKLLKEYDTDVNKTNHVGWTPLIYATRYGQPKCVQLLLDHGADVHIRGTSPWSPLHFAAYNNEFESAALLLAAGADPDRPESDIKGNRTPIELAKGQKHLDVVELLLTGAGVTVKPVKRS